MLCSLQINEVFGYTQYSSDDILTVMMLLRIYLLFRVFREELRLNHESVSYWGKLAGVDLGDPILILKQLVLDFPLYTMPAIYIMTIALSGYALMVLERPTDQNFFYYDNARWCVMTTMTTVGYGDLYPTTNSGRALAMFICAMALLCYTLLFIGVRNVMYFDAKELKAFHQLKFKQWKAVRRVQAAKVMQAFWRSAAPISQKQQIGRFTTDRRDSQLTHEMRRLRELNLLQPIEQRNVGNLLWQLAEKMRVLKEQVETIKFKTNAYLAHRAGKRHDTKAAALSRI
jgi:hypothetical protein